MAALHGTPTLLAVQLADFGKQQADVVSQLGHGADRRARIFDRIALINRDGGWNAFHALDLGFVHALQELPRVGRKTFHVAPLAFGVQRVKRQTRFARATHASDDDEFVQGQVQ